jgi:hypothetical protein
MPDIKNNTEKLLQFVAQKFEAAELDNNSMVQLIELAGGYLNLKTITAYAKENNLSYNGAKKYRQKVQLFGTKFIMENQ